MDELTPYPTGTITFLFTDIEGSTALWEACADEMRIAIARHDVLLREIVESNGGYLFKNTGDGIAAAFSDAPAAVKAALAAQIAIDAEPWPTATALSVRIGLHTGDAELRDGDYFGSTLSRCVRLMAAGHGRQILLSETTQELSRDRLPVGSTLLRLGIRRLKDLRCPETVFQLQHPALPDTYPPLTTLDSPALPNNLPQQLTSFIGREQVLDEVRNLLGKTRLLTLAGAGGSGKTRLSIQVAAEALEEYPDGAWLVELAPLTDPALVLQTVASALGVREQPGQAIEQTLIENLKEKHLLLILDNAEHVVAACARFVDTLLRRCPRVMVLVTSREPLAISGEQVYRVPPLSLPASTQVNFATAESLTYFEAVRLFVDRAQLVRSDFAVTNSNASALAQLCFQLDGIPLAIELAAARVRSLAVEQITDRLDSRFRLLTGGDRSAMPRQQTLRALVDWSYDLLTEDERILLGRLSIFVGGWTLAAAESVCAGNPIEDYEVIDLLTSLVDKSLVLADEDAGQTRYRMLETLRQYAIEKREASDENATLSQRHLEYFVALAEEANLKMGGPDQTLWLNRLEVEHDNLRAALAWSGSDVGAAHEPTSELRLASVLARLWDMRGYLTEGRQHLQTALRHAAKLEPADASASDSPFLTLKARALNAAGNLARSQGDLAAAHSYYTEGLALRRAMGSKHGIAVALQNLGNVAWNRGDFAEARSLYEEGIALNRELNNAAGLAIGIGNLGNVAWAQGEVELSHELFSESLELSRDIGDAKGIALALSNLGSVRAAHGDLSGAQSLQEESLALNRELGNKRGIASSLASLADLSAVRGDFDEAKSLLEQSLTLQRELGNQHGIAMNLASLGNVAKEQGDLKAARAMLTESLTLNHERADRRSIAETLGTFASLVRSESDSRQSVALWAAAQSLQETLGIRLTPPNQAEHDRQINQARAELGEVAFAAAWAEGRALTIDAAVALALGVAQ